MIYLRIIDRQGRLIQSGDHQKLGAAFINDAALARAIALVASNPLLRRRRVGGVIVERA